MAAIIEKKPKQTKTKTKEDKFQLQSVLANAALEIALL